MKSGLVRVFYVIFVTSAVGQVSHSPIDVVGQIAQEISLPCSVPSIASYREVRWEDHVYNPDRARSIIYDGTTIRTTHPRYSAYTVDSNYTLTINLLVGGDIGLYYCVGITTSGVTREQIYRLSIIALPQCSNTDYFIEGKNVSFTCLSTFKGQLPQMNFMLDDKPVEESNIKNRTVNFFGDVIGIYAQAMLMFGPQNEGQILRCVLVSGPTRYTCQQKVHVKFQIFEEQDLVVNEPAFLPCGDANHQLEEGEPMSWKVNDSLILSITAQGHTETYANPGVYHPSRYEFVRANQTLIIKSMTEGDAGQYTCEDTTNKHEVIVNLIPQVFQTTATDEQDTTPYYSPTDIS